MKKTRGKIYLLPSLFTLANLFFGFLSLVFTFHAKYGWAALWIIFAAIMDGLDGIIARSTKTQSEFGSQFDSLVDSFSFGAAPAVLLFFWGLKEAGTSGIFFSFVYLAAGILRLARYNVIQIQKSQPDRRYYTGLTIPSASVMISSIIFFHPQPLETRLSAFLLALLIAFISFCMISTLKYRNFLNFNLRKKIDIKIALILAIILSSLIFYTKIFLILFFSINVLSGPFLFLLHWLKKHIQKRPQEKQSSS